MYCKILRTIAVLITNKYTKIMKLTKAARKKLMKDNVTRAMLCAAFDASYDSVQRWARENKKDNKLTTMTALPILKKGLGLKQEEILTAE